MHAYSSFDRGPIQGLELVQPATVGRPSRKLLLRAGRIFLWRAPVDIFENLCGVA